VSQCRDKASVPGRLCGVSGGERGQYFRAFLSSSAKYNAPSNP
jgi:hypothetical protein